MKFIIATMIGLSVSGFCGLMIGYSIGYSDGQFSGRLEGKIEGYSLKTISDINKKFGK